MISVSDILSILDKIPVWKQLTTLPKRVAELEERVKALESSKGASRGHDPCPRCHKDTFELKSSKPDDVFGDLGDYRHSYECAECGYQKEVLSS